MLFLSLVLFFLALVNANLDQKCQQFKSFIPTTPERITTPGAKEDHGWYWKCAMIKINALKGKKLDIFKAVSLKT
uniref:Fibrinogen C-terminal domain-containing protein n=1 Tax=Megaselia scalaris TaxID=36166 RepID=T1GBP6_MEGSC